MTQRIIITLLAIAPMTSTRAQRSMQHHLPHQPANFRFMYNCDGMNMFTDPETPMTPETLYPYVDEIAKTGATSLFISPNVGMVMNYPSKVTEMIGEKISPELESTIKPEAKAGTLVRGINNLRSLVKAGYDPLNLIIERARNKKMEAFISFRPNEVHSVENEDDILFSTFWKNHPEWRIGKYGDSVAKAYRDIMGPNTSAIVTKWLPAGLDFSVPEVRKHQHEVLRELCERYHPDGLEIDFQRFPMYFKPGQEQANTKLLTQWLRDIRKMIQSTSAKTKLVCRVMATPGQNLAIGLDPATWAREKLVDFIIVSHYLHNDFPLPISDFRKILPVNYPIYASIEVSPDMAAYRTIANYLWQQDINGIYLFNFFTSRESKKEPPFSEIRQIGYPELLDKLMNSDSMNDAEQPQLLVANKHSGTLSFINPLTFGIKKTIYAGPNPHEIVVTPDQQFAYLSNFEPPGNTISVIDLKKQKLIKRINTGTIGRIHGAAMTPDGQNAYFTAAESGCIVEIDIRTNSVTRTIKTFGETSHMVYVSPDAKTIYTGNLSSADISVLDRATGKLLTKIPAGKGCGGMAFTPDGKQLWATNETDGTITIVDLASNKALETVNCPGIIKRIKFTDDGKRALVTSWAERGELVVLDVVSRKEIRRIKVGSRAIGVEISPDGRFAFVGCEDASKAVVSADGSEKISRKDSSDGIHIVDLKKLAVVSVLKTGLGPDPMIIWYPEYQEFTSLFNGKDLTGWKIHGTEKWYVKDGELICENGPDKEYGYLSTTKKYKNFILKLKFKQEVNGNSGVFIRSSIDGTTISGWQVEVAPKGDHTGGIYESYGRGWLKLPLPENEEVLKPGEWNDMRIEVRGGTVTTWLNNKQMVHLTDSKIAAADGFIALQIHNGNDIYIRWKDIMIREL